jgi:L-fuconolactonase
MAAKDPRLCATIAHAPLEKGKAVEADLATLAAIPMVKGIRRLIETEMNPAFCLEPGFIEAVKMLPRFGFSFDICVKHFAMTYAIELARRCPDTQFILDHIGKPDIKNGLKDPWWSQIRELAHEWLDQYIIESIEEAQQHATQWLWTYNNERPNMGIGGITPAQN